jgi:hypothetical protein
MARFFPSGFIQIAGNEYVWTIRHLGGLSSTYEGQRGLSVFVNTNDSGSRELILDFAFADYFFGAPKSLPEFTTRLARCIEIALVAKWAPSSRGKPVRLNVIDIETK